VSVVPTKIEMSAHGVVWNSDFTKQMLEIEGVQRYVGGLQKYRFETSDVEIFALTAPKNGRGYLVVVVQPGWPTRHFSFNDGKYPYNIAFDCLREVVSIATQTGVHEKKFADIGIQASATALTTPTPHPTSPFGSIDCNVGVSVVPTKIEMSAHGVVWKSDFTEGMLEIEGVQRYVGGLKKYRFETSDVEIFALAAPQNRASYLVVVVQPGWPTRHFSFNDGRYPYNIAFDCQREVVSISTQTGVREKKFADIGVQVSER